MSDPALWPSKTAEPARVNVIREIAKRQKHVVAANAVQQIAHAATSADRWQIWFDKSYVLN